MSGAGYRFEHDGSRAFAVRARNLNRGERALRIAQSFKQPLCITQAKFNSESLMSEAEKILERFIEHRES